MTHPDSSANPGNMHLFDEQGRITKYDDVHQILRSFYTVRLNMYHKRKEHMLNEMTQKWQQLDSRVRFILMVIEDKINIRNRKKKELVKELITLKFPPFPKNSKKEVVKLVNAVDGAEDAEAAEAAEADSDESGDYSYLLSMPLYNLTYEKVKTTSDEWKLNHRRCNRC